MKWYKFYVADYIQETHHLPDAEDLAYRRLLDLYYLSEAPLIADPVVLARHVKLDLDCVEPVLKEFFELTAGGYVHAVADSQIQRHRHQSEQNRRTAIRPRRRGCLV
jgi:uncharacterized protein YdaU (DUF1376 family)